MAPPEMVRPLHEVSEGMNREPPEPTPAAPSFFVKQGSVVHGPMKQADLIEHMAQGSVSKSALWSSNQLLWAPLSTLPHWDNARQIGALPPKHYRTPAAPRSNRRPASAGFRLPVSPLQIALIIALGGILALTLTLVMLLTFGKGRGDGANDRDQARHEATKAEVKKALAAKPAKPRPVPKKRGDEKEPDNPLALNDGRDLPREGRPNALAIQDAPNENARLNPEQIFDRYGPSVAQITTEESTGSGFLVRNRLLVTNHHLLRGKNAGDRVTVTFHSATGDEAKAKRGFIKKMIPELDLAFVSVPSTLPVLELAGWDQIRPGRQVVAIGSPGLGDGRAVVPNTICQGMMGQFLQVDGIKMLQLSIAVNPGNSGGPAIDPFGKVIGVVTAKGIQVEAIAFSVPAYQIQDQLDQWNQDPKE